MDRRLFLNLGGLSLVSALVPLPSFAQPDDDAFSFSADGSQFLLNKSPFQIRSGEMHPARIPHQYWLHRIQMAKAMGMNTIAIYVIWNFHETQEGVFDFASPSHDIAEFIRLCQQEQMWVLLRAGPYVCGEWDNGGIPAYLLADDSVRLRANSGRSPIYMAAATRYIETLAKIVRPLMINQGGPILMVQIENEFGSYGNDAVYLEEIRQRWINQGIHGPFYTQDGLPELEKNKTNLPGAAIGLSGGEVPDILQARERYPTAPVMCGELYPGWLTHWGENQFQGTEVDISATLREFMRLQISFNIYVIHGGTNFGFTAGANMEQGQLQPVITSYDYAAPISEQGMPTRAYFKYRDIIATRLTTRLPEPPAAINTISCHDIQRLTPALFASLWDNLPEPIHSAQPQIMEKMGQSSGFVLYRTTLQNGAGGNLHVPALNDYATVFWDEHYVGAFTRVTLPRSIKSHYNIVNSKQSLKLKAQAQSSTLDIFVEALGHINYGPELGDRKGILKPVSVHDSAISGWQTFRLPMDSDYIAGLKNTISNINKAGLFFKLTLTLEEIGDTYLDMRHWSKGCVWVNGNNLGRYWQAGPQQRLYCPAPWLKKGRNEIIIFDLHQLHSAAVSLEKSLA